MNKCACMSVFLPTCMLQCGYACVCVCVIHHGPNVIIVDCGRSNVQIALSSLLTTLIARPAASSSSGNERTLLSCRYTFHPNNTPVISHLLPATAPCCV